MNRKAYVAGQFYPRQSENLKQELNSYLKRVPEHHGKVLGIIAPHAGYIYSGQCAAFAYQTLKNCTAKYAVVIAPSHISNHIAFSVGDYQYYETPVGKVRVDKNRVSALLENNVFTFEPQLHEREHSLEVQLPFVQTMLPDVEILPIIFANQTLENSKYLAEVLFDLYRDDLDETVFIVSTDLSHYFPAELAEKKDKCFISEVVSGNPESLWKAMKAGKCEACGIGGVLTLMELGRLVGNTRFKELCYYHSGRINEDNDRVVGYTSIALECLVD
jgi:AmmeMemoRadiSam system protein B